MDPLVGRTVGGVAIDAKLGAGGMASVYRGRDLEDGEAPRAIKLLSVTSHDHIQARFQREGRIGHRLRHPLLVRVHRYGVSGDYHYLVMDLIEGEDLAHVLQRTGALAWPLAAAIGRDIARALTAIHAMNMVHRDLKPQNVLLDGHGALKLADFGLASWREGPPDLPDPGLSLTRTGDAFGTPVYMSPEQFADAKNAGPAADLYALGVLLFEALAGRTPFNASTPHELARLHKATAPPSLDALAADAPPDLRALIGRLLAKAPAERPASAKEVVDALTGIAARGKASPLPLQDRAGTTTALWDPDVTPPVPGPRTTGGARRRSRAVALALVLAALSAGAFLGWQSPQVRLLLATPEERPRYEAVMAALARVDEDPEAFVDAVEQYLRDFGQSGLLRHTVRELRHRPVLARGDDLYLVAETGADALMVHVPGGRYVVGREGAEGDEHSRRREVRLQGYLIDRAEVSNRLYRTFLARWEAAGGHHLCGNDGADHHAPLRRLERSRRSPDPDGPILGVTPWDALEYASFYGRRLPTEAEWEVAASWDPNRGRPRPYPWGATEPSDQDHRFYANLAFAEWGEVGPEGFVLQATSSGSFEFDESPLGLLDVAGNAAEWCAGRVPLPGPQPIRGGSMLTDSAEDALLARRRERDPAPPPPEDVGFRTAVPFEE